LQVEKAMTKSLNTLFMEAGGPTVQYNGLSVHRAIFRHVKQRGRYLVRFINAISKPLQGVGIAIDKGSLTVEDATAKRIALWYDYSPAVVTVYYRPSREGGRLSIYNIWEDENGTVQAWLMNAGMLMKETGNKILLRCSDGRGEPTFDDLIVEIEFLND
jgi:hypothetical protein